MDDVLADALGPVLRDVRVSGVPEPQVLDDDWADDPAMPTAMLLLSPDGSRASLRVDRDEPEPHRIAMVADQVQEWVIEELWPTAPTNWPPCPDHPGTHPLTAKVVHGDAMWTCPADGSPFVAVGALR
jgi:hypothetical protein